MKNMTNQELVEEFHKPVITKLKKGKVYLYIWGVALADMQLISNLIKELFFIMCY